MVEKNKPNIVFIMSDQQRYDTLECYGNDWINTPRLNELAKDSYVVENAYVTQPVVLQQGHHNDRFISSCCRTNSK